jgi:hypothetical protein
MAGRRALLDRVGRVRPSDEYSYALHTLLPSRTFSSMIQREEVLALEVIVLLIAALTVLKL